MKQSEFHILSRHGLLDPVHIDRELDPALIERELDPGP